VVDEDKLDQLIMLSMGAFSRRVSSTWINPAKSRLVEDLSRVFFKDESPEGLYPAFIVPENLTGQIVIVTPIQDFKNLLDLWKKENPQKVEAMRKIVENEEKR